MSNTNSTTTLVLDAAAIKAKEAQKMAKRLAEVKKNCEKYPHALPETTVYDEAVKKYKCQIKCTKTGDTSRWVYTSDLHQVTMCEAATKEAQSQKKAEVRAARTAVKAAKAAKAIEPKAETEAIAS